MKRTIIIIGVLLSAVTLLAQNEVDALRYSYTLPGGTARSAAMGGSFGAMGADASTLIFNPAGIGVYRSSDFTFTPAFAITNTDANMNGSIGEDYDVNFNINNLSYIGAIPVNSDKGLSNINLGFSYNRLNNFHENILIEGQNNENSMTDWFASSGNGFKPGQLSGFYSALAWDSYLIDPSNADTTAYTSAYYGDYGQTQKQFIYRNGYQGEYNFAASANIMHKLFIGASLGIQAIRYDEVKTLQEIDENGAIADFNSFTFKENLETRGSGINFKFGLLYSPVPWMRVGGAIHTPTFYDLQDTYFSSVSSDFEDASKSSEYNSPYGTFDYELTSPFRANASMGFIIAKQALLNIDYEYLDYSMARLRSNDYTFFDENSTIRTGYKAAHNVKLGLEYRYGPISFRAGGAYYDTPYVSEHSNSESYTLVYSGGVGVRSDVMYFDIAYSHLTNSLNYYMYDGYGITSPATEIAKTQGRILMTVGFKF